MSQIASTVKPTPSFIHTFIPCRLMLPFIFTFFTLMLLPTLPCFHLSHLWFTPVEMFHDCEPVGLCTLHSRIQFLLSPLRLILKEIDIPLLPSEVKHFIQCCFMLT